MAIVLNIAVRYLAARHRQSLLTVAGIVIGVVALTVMQSLMGGFRQSFINSILGTAPHILVRGRDIVQADPGSPARDALRSLSDPLVVQLNRPPLPDEEDEIRTLAQVERAVQEVPGVAAVAPLASGQVLFGFSGNWEPVTLQGILPSAHGRVLLEFPDNLSGGRVSDLEVDTHGVILGYLLAERMRVGLGDRVTARGADGAVTGLRIVALHDGGVYDVDNTSAWVNLRRAQSLLGLDTSVSSVQVRCRDFEEADAIGRAIEYSTGYEAESWVEANRNYLGLIRMITSIMSLVSVFTMSVAGFGIAGNLITTVGEKTFDIGVLKAMGMSSRALSGIFLTLALLMMAIGLSIGLALSYGAVELISRLPSASRPMPGALISAKTMPMVKHWSIYATSVGFAFVIGLAAGFAPARRAAGMDPMHILRDSA